MQPGPADRVVQRRERAQRARFGGVVEHAQDQAARGDPQRHPPARRQRPTVRQHLRVDRRQQHRGREPGPAAQPGRGEGQVGARGQRRARVARQLVRGVRRGDAVDAGHRADRDQQPPHRVRVRAPHEHGAHDPEGQRHRDLGGVRAGRRGSGSPRREGARPRRRRAPRRRPRRPAPPGHRSGSPRDAASRANGRSATAPEPGIAVRVGAAHLPCSARARGAGLGATGRGCARRLVRRGARRPAYRDVREAPRAGVADRRGRGARCLRQHRRGLAAGRAVLRAGRRRRAARRLAPPVPGGAGGLPRRPPGVPGLLRPAGAARAVVVGRSGWPRCPSPWWPPDGCCR